MVQQLNILQNVIQRLSNIRTDITGYLYGIVYEETLTIISFSLNSIDDDENEIKPLDVQYHMPTEVNLIGILYVDQEKPVTPDTFKDIDGTDNPLIIKYCSYSDTISPFYYINETLQPTTYEEISNDFFKNFFCVRAITNLPLFSEKKKVLEALQQIIKNIDPEKLGFYFKKTKRHFFKLKNSNNDCFQEILYEELANSLFMSHFNSIPIDTVTVSIFSRISLDKSSEKQLLAPVLKYFEHGEYYKCYVKIDALALISKKITLARFFEILVESIRRNLRLISTSFHYYSKIKDATVCLPEPIHFNPLILGHLLTVVYPNKWSNLQTSEYRKHLHRKFGIDMTKPCFRKGSSLLLLYKYNDDLLVNPHKYVKNPTNSQVDIVHGLYQFYHYTSADTNWGCAYRALQTISSWFRFQGYTEKDVPQISEIQECLVDIGDKPSSFLNSSQWIGSTEVGYVLESLFNVSVKILCASSGSEMVKLVIHLADHFKTQGTPVMIGGNRLAYVILGVSYNDQYENVKFLILDPHYIGAENLKQITTKGYCGWKDKNFWAKNAFYNMCLPQISTNLY
ncbi:PREDICTED: ufm1-specific protease 2-like [Ceratosolen solmsi marchali]|uniref:Ufm1-specific protease 2-like n=1 Tax=Ceratosolen solmsi marchali TaxID=326594 RepID=A0AAJ7DYB6_9HYME|nr:PREDICTED: ufm1-specific protease 2-like [Ceratosolen solmsi marchali]